MVAGLAPFGLTVPMWFCPTRPREFANANATAQSRFGSPISSVNDLNRYFLLNWTGQAIINHNYWVPRRSSASSPDGMFPTTSAAEFPTAPATQHGWPSKTSDRGIALVPFISDKCYAGYGTRPTKNLGDINPASGHQFRGLNSVNAAFADGHVETRKRALIQPQYFGDSRLAVWFY
jgi:prepilin-type processing-associated H-X9-DG protein